MGFEKKNSDVPISSLTLAHTTALCRAGRIQQGSRPGTGAESKQLLALEALPAHASISQLVPGRETPWGCPPLGGGWCVKWWELRPGRATQGPFVFLTAGSWLVGDRGLNVC